MKKVFAWVALSFLAVPGAPLLLLLMIKWWQLYKGLFMKWIPNVATWPDGTPIYGSIATLSLVLFLLIVFALTCGIFGERVPLIEREVHTSHACNICKKILLIGEGAHSPKADGDCLCVCERCLPTVIKGKGILE